MRLILIFFSLLFSIPSLATPKLSCEKEVSGLAYIFTKECASSTHCIINVRAQMEHEGQHVEAIIFIKGPKNQPELSIAAELASQGQEVEAKIYVRSSDLSMFSAVVVYKEKNDECKKVSSIKLKT